MKLWDYQDEAVDFIGSHKKVYLALDMGLGKTITALAAADKFAGKNILLIAEKNEIVNSENFRREVDSYFDGLSYRNLREELLPSKGAGRSVCGINPDALVKQDLDEIAELFDFVIMDEATMAKTTTTKRFKRVRKVCDLMKYVVLLSGTPMMNGASELYAPLLLLGHPLAGDGTADARQAFEEIFAGGHRRKIRNTGIWYQDYAWWAKGANHVRELRYLISDRFFFKQKGETGIFKHKERRLEYVPMQSLEWQVEYGRAWDTYLEEAGKRDVDMDNVMELQRLIENGQLYQVNSKWKARRVVEDIISGKFGDRRIIVFSLFVETDTLVRKLLRVAGVSFESFDEINAFKSGSAKVLVGRIKAHGKGGNAAEASVCLFVDMDFVPASNIQAENRIDRPEQTRDMKIIYYITEGKDIIDEHVRFINQDKMRKIDEFMRPLGKDEIPSMPQNVATLRERYSKAFKKLGV